MKTIVTLIAALAMSCNVVAQDYKHLYKDQKDLSKLTQKVRMEKAGKDAAKEAKKYEKQGWKPMPGKLPLAKQFDKAYNMQVELEEGGRLRYIYGTNTAVAQTQAAAQMAAAAAAREEIASAMGVSLTALIEEKIQQEQMSAIEAKTITEISQESEQIFSQNMGKTETVVEAYRILQNNNYEVMIGIVYPTSSAVKQMDDVIKELGERGQ